MGRRAITRPTDRAPTAPRFDAARNAWILSRYADVAAALKEPGLAIGGATSNLHDLRADQAARNAREAHTAVRQAVAHAFSPDRLAVLQADIAASACQALARLPTGQRVDLLREFAEPWSLALAVASTNAAPEDAERLARVARDVFLAAAASTDSELRPPAQAAVTSLASSLSGAPDAIIAVQTFVALSQTLPHFLASAWLSLLQHRGELVRLRTQPALMPQAVEELLRHAGLSRAVFRRARVPLTIGGVKIAAGERVILMLSRANHDPASFPDPHRLDLGRSAVAHLALGRGSHSCSGAALIRIAVAAATGALIRGTRDVALAGEADWIGGFAMRAPASLPVCLMG